MMRVAAAGLLVSLCVLSLTASGWSADPPQLVPQLALDAGGHTGWVRRVLVDQYHHQLISISQDKTIRFWSLDTYEPVCVLRPPIGRGSEGELYAAALSPDASLLAVSGFIAPLARGDHRVLLIGLPGGEMVARLQGSTGAIYGLAFSPDGRWLAGSGDDGVVRVWEVATRKLAHAWTGHTKRVPDVAWNPDGTLLASASWDKTARLWALGKGQVAVRQHPDGLGSVAWSHNGKWLATGGSEAMVRVWDQAGRTVMAAKSPRTVQGISFSDDDRWLAYGWGSRYHSGRGAGLFSVPDGKPVLNFEGHKDTPVSAVFTHHDQRLTFADAHGDLCVWDTRSASLLHRMHSAGAELYADGWSPDGRAIGYGYRKTPGSPIRATTPLEHSFCLEALDFGPLPDRSFRRAQAERGELSIERVKYRYLRGNRNGAHIWKYEIPAQDANIRSRTMLPGARAAVGFDGGLIVLNAANGQPIYQLPGHTDAVWALAPSPDDRYLLTASGDQTLEIWKLDNYEHILSLFFAGDEWIAWTPRGYYAASLAGESLMGWHIQTSPDKMAEFYSASLFHNSLYRPDVIRRILPLGNPLAALREADRQRHVDTEVLTIGEHLPPAVTLETVPAAPDAANPSKLTLRARALPGGRDAVKSLTLLVDGRRAPAEILQPAAADPALPAGGKEAQWTVTLTPGEHSLVAKADTQRSFQLSEPVQIKPGEKAERLPRLFVLAMGVSTYDQVDLQTAGAAADAEALAATLKTLGQAEFREVLVHVLTERQVTQASLEAGLAWLKQFAGPDDVGIVYFAGRAAVDSQGELLLLPHEWRAGPSGHGLSAAKVQQSLAGTQGKMLFLLDARYAAATQATATHDYCGSESRSSGAAEASAVDNLLRTLSSDDMGVSVMGRSTGADEPSAASPAGAAQPGPAARGPFAQALLDGLGGQADSNHDGRVELSELEAFVRVQLGRATAGSARAQVSRPGLVPSYPLTRP